MSFVLSALSSVLSFLSVISVLFLFSVQLWCCVCCEGFISSSNLKRPMISHEKLAICWVDCGKGFSRLSHLAMHRWIHTGQKLCVSWSINLLCCLPSNFLPTKSTSLIVCLVTRLPSFNDLCNLERVNRIWSFLGLNCTWVSQKCNMPFKEGTCASHGGT